MRHLKKGRRADRAHQYRVVASRLGFHLEGDHYRDVELIAAIRAARDALLKSAELLDREDQRDSLDKAS
jgi:hypothetical protein